MKKTFRIRSLLLVSALGFSGGIAAWAQIPAEVPLPKMITEIDQYRNWKVANYQYIEMQRSVIINCAPPGPLKVVLKSDTKGTAGPHDKKWLRVYVNSIGESAMLTQKYPKYPAGTVIVKEKLPNVIIPIKGQPPLEKAGSTPELLTVMIKREANYDKANGDWEYMVTDGKGEKVTERGKLPSCQGCHKPYEKTDYIVRSYLPASVMKSLKDLDDADTPKSESAYIEPAK